MYKVIFSSIVQAQDTLEITDSSIDNNSIIDVYSDNEGLYAAGISVEDHTLTITFDGTLSGGSIAVVVNNIEGELIIPSKTSQLQNDSGYITENDIPTIPSKTSQLENDSGFITIEDVPSAQDEYSTTEKICGKWTDGRNVYKITFTYPFTSLSGSNTTIYTASEDITLINAEGFMRNNNNNNQYILPYSNGNNTNVIMMYDKRNVIMRIANDSWDSKFSPLTVTIYYLKDSEVV